MKKEFYLLIDSCITTGYAVSGWLKEFSGSEQFKGILIREDKPSDSILEQRNNFHAEYAGQKVLTREMNEKLSGLYSTFNKKEKLYSTFYKREKAMINMFGVPINSATSANNTFFLGQDINGEYSRNWVTENCSKSQPFIFTHISQIFKPWWIEITGHRLLNVHSAVLPYARGVYSIENIAALNDIEFFKKSAGVTIHFIDQGVDTGPIIRAERIIDPFRFNSIWELKGYTLMTGYRLYIEMAKHIIFDHETVSVGIAGDPALRGTNFRASNLTERQKHRAEEGYLSMKKRYYSQVDVQQSL